MISPVRARHDLTMLRKHYGLLLVKWNLVPTCKGFTNTQWDSLPFTYTTLAPSTEQDRSLKYEGISSNNVS